MAEELTRLEGSKSIVWDFFGFPSKDGKYIEPNKKKRTEVHCKLCKQIQKYSGNTTNLRFHLESHHCKEFKEAEQAAQPSTTSRVSVKSSSTTKQISISESFQHNSPLPRTSPRWRKLTDAVSYFIAKDMHPFDTVNDHGFQHMVRTFEPRYNPPDRKTLSTHYIPELYEKEKERVIEQIRGIQHFAITTDMWTSRANHSYCSLTVHYINDSFKLQSHLLEAKEFSDRHTGNNIAEELPVILDRWGLKPEMLSAATTDNGSNIVSAMEILKWTHMRCFSHTLQLAVHATLNLHKVSKAVSRCRRLVNHFHHSYKSSYLLRQKQEDLKHDQHSLIHDVITRWNSTYYMIDRILKQQQPLCAALLELRKSDLMPSEEEFSVMETFVEIMKPVVEITEAIGAQKWVTISTVRPLLFKLLNKQFEIVECDSSLAKSFKTTMYSNLSPRYCGLPLLLLNKATFLDPRLKGLSFLSIEDKKATLESIKDEAAQITIPQSVSLNSLEEPPAKRPREDHKLLKLLDSVMECGNSMSETSNPVDRANSEVIRYIEDNTSCDDPLEWWKMNSSRYPLLSILAKMYLCIPATSVPSERAFSLSGYIVNEKRSCLLPENVNMLVFLAENLQ